jgi:Holliday junction resolvase RusA-like endonuclease
MTSLLVFPWSCVLHDNHRFIPARGRLITSPEYRAKKEMAEVVALTALPQRLLVNERDLILVADCWFPDKRKRDAGNYRKLITDAMTGIAYADDAQLVSETWRRAGYDKVNPRIEVRLEAAA